jgi:hypothetical protein
LLGAATGDAGAPAGDGGEATQDVAASAVYLVLVGHSPDDPNKMLRWAYRLRRRGLLSSVLRHGALCGGRHQHRGRDFALIMHIPLHVPAALTAVPALPNAALDML